MVNHYVYYTNNSVKIGKNVGATAFSVYTSSASGTPGPTGLPGDVSGFRFYGTSLSTQGATECVSQSYNPASSFIGTFIWNSNPEADFVTNYNIRQISAQLLDGSLNTVPWSGDPTTIIDGNYLTTLGTTSGVGELYATGTMGCGVSSFQIAAINSYGTGNYVNTGSSLTALLNGIAYAGCASITCQQSGNSLVVNWVTGLVSCTGNYYQGQVKVYDYNTGNDTGLSLNSVNAGTATLNISSLTKEKYYYVTVKEFHYVGFIPTGCSELVKECSKFTVKNEYSNLFWYDQI